MKRNMKAYIKPESEIIGVESEVVLAATSIPTGNDKVDPGNALAPALDVFPLDDDTSNDED